MKIGKRDISKKMLVFAVVALMCIGFASAALINYAVTSMQATLVVTPQTGLVVGVLQGFDGIVDPSTLSGWDFTGPVDLTGTGFTAGDVAVITIMVNNTATAPITTNINMALSYADTAAVGEPNNCIADGSYSAPGAGQCILASNGCLDAGTGLPGLCIDGQELDVFGIAMWNNALVKWDPEVTDNPFGIDCGSVEPRDLGNPDVLTPGGFNIEGYLDAAGTGCFWNFQNALETSTAPANPLTFTQGPITLNPGVQYIAVALKTKADPSNNVQIAPGTYSLTVGTS